MLRLPALHRASALLACAILLPACSGGDSGGTTTPPLDAAATLRLDAHYATPAVGEALTLHATPLTAAGAPAKGARVVWSTPDAGVSVDTAGHVSASAPGLARVVASSGAAADTAWLAVLGPQSSLATAFAGGSFESAVRTGDALSIPVTLDLRASSPTGDLGSAEVEVAYDPAVLEYVGVDGPAGSSVEANGSAPGRVRLAYASAGARGTSSFALATLRMRVVAGAGRVGMLSLSYPAAPTTTSFAALPAPVGVGGRVRVQ